WNESFPFEDWMNGSTLQLRRQVYGCCNEVRYEDMLPLGRFVQYIPKFIFIAPEYEETKSRHVEGRAYVDFPLSQTVINPDYRDNRRELGKILSSIDTLKSDSDIEIKSLSIKGFASPEGPYDNNTRLAKGRTEALKDYVSNLFSFPDNFITTSFESENWEGLREFVAASSVPHKNEILDIIDHSQRDPDTKEWLIKSRYKEDYAFIYNSCYAGLRRSDYFIDYTVRNYTDVDEIEKVFLKSPGKLSLFELFNLSTRYEVGSPEFEKVFEVAVTLYPDNEIANTNAAGAALKAGRLAKAAEYLEKAGESAHADYFRAIWHWMSGDRYAALSFFEKAEKGGIPEAADAIAKINATSR
ncbi:MAG: tetratricopeptide repeat protein, partial [Candidatus Cryptobacteroides sp.]